MHPIPRRDFLSLGVTASLGLVSAAPEAANVHQQILDLAARQQERRRARFASVKSKADLEALQKTLRQSFLGLLDGLPAASEVPPVKNTGRIEGDDYLIDKLVFESFPGYFVSALLYRPKKIDTPLPGILSPCGHSAVGKADGTYQVLHVNLVKRGHVVLTYDPVGQGERSQFWDAGKGRSRYNLTCGEHAVLGNPLYLLGTNLARFRIWDGMRGLDYLASLPEVDAKRLGCVGSSGGGTLTAYIAALDPRVSAAVISCYITTLPRRMGNRIEKDPDADPEQDVFGFVSEGIDHAGLLALRAPRPTLVNAARLDFFPIEGARESFAEARKLYETADAGDRVRLVEADAKHGLTQPLRRAAYNWFDRWLGGKKDDPQTEEVAVKPRPAKELLVCAQGQVSLSFRSKPLLPLALEEFRKQKKRPRVSLKELLRLDPELTDFRLTPVAAGKGKATLVLCVNGIEGPDWRDEKEFTAALARQGLGVSVVDPRGVGALRPMMQVRGHEYGDPLCGVEENIAYNAFLAGKSLIGMRVTDVLAAVTQLVEKTKPAGVILCGRRDAALVACLAAAVGPEILKGVAVEEMLLSLLPLFEAEGQAINAASVLPRLLRDFGDIPDVLAAMTPRKVLASAPRGKRDTRLPSVKIADRHFTREPAVFLEWLSA